MTDFTISPAGFDVPSQAKSSTRSFDSVILLGAGILIVVLCAAFAALPIDPNALPTENLWLFVP